jgi:hypothetical protein
MSATLTIFELCGHIERPIGEARSVAEARQICRGELAARDDADAVRAVNDIGEHLVAFERGPGGEIVDFSALTA